MIIILLFFSYFSVCLFFIVDSNDVKYAYVIISDCAAGDNDDVFVTCCSEAYVVRLCDITGGFNLDSVV